MLLQRKPLLKIVNDVPIGQAALRTASDVLLLVLCQFVPGRAPVTNSPIPLSASANLREIDISARPIFLN
jgi:hypothetical protein